MDEYLIEASERAVQQKLNSVIAGHRELAIPGRDLQPHQYLVRVCVDCGDDLEVFRMQKGRTRCVICQTQSESRRGR